MEKLMYLIWAKRGDDADDMQRGLLGETQSALLERGALRLSMDVADADADVPPPVPWPDDEAPLAAVISFWMGCHDRRGRFEEILLPLGERVAGYLVTESLYMDYGGNPHSAPRNWPDGERSPGVVQVTLLEQPERLTYEQWISHWYGVQSPMSERVQPRARYVRNAVARPLSADAPPYKGIVEECWASKEIPQNPMLYYGANGSKQTMRENMATMMESVSQFLDFDRIRVVMMSEYLLSS